MTGSFGRGLSGGLLDGWLDLAMRIDLRAGLGSREEVLRDPSACASIFVKVSVLAVVRNGMDDGGCETVEPFPDLRLKPPDFLFKLLLGPDGLDELLP